MSCGKDENKQKEAGIGPFKTVLGISKLCVFVRPLCPIFYSNFRKEDRYCSEAIMASLSMSIKWQTFKRFWPFLGLNQYLNLLL